MPVTKILTAGIGEARLARHRCLPRARRLQAVGARVRELQPVDVLNLAEASGLRGRGGAGFPTGKKWSFLPKDKDLRYLVCNCDEAEPGTFKDHMLLEETPHLVLEGILLGAYAIASHHAFIYIRGEFKRGYEIFCAAFEEARAAGLRRQERLRQRFRSGGDGASRRRRLHLRRRDRAAQLARRQARRAASEAAVSRDRRSVRHADGRQQRRDARVSRADSRTRRGLVRGGRDRAQQGLQDRLDLRARAANPATTKFRWERRCASSSRSPADCARGARSRRCSPAADRRLASSRSTLDLPYDYESHGEGRIDARFGRLRRLRRHDRFRRRPPTISCGSSRTSRAASARRAAKAELDRARARSASCRPRRSRATTTCCCASRAAITGLNLCPLGDSIEPFLKSVLLRFPDQFKARIAATEAAPA